MPTLADSLLVDGRRERVVTDCAQMIEDHVAALKGFKGLSLKTVFAMLKGNDAHAVHGAMGRLIPDFVHSLEPLHVEFLASEQADFGLYITEHREIALAALIAVTDARIARSKNGTLRAAYSRVRGSIESELRGVIPSLGAVLGRHLGGRR